MIQTAHGPIAHRELGDGDPVLFIHGLLVDGRLWSGVAERLSDGFRCVVPDWPMGSHKHPMNEDADLSPAGLARIVVAFMDELGLERATVVGNDTGGAVSQVLAANHPERVERLVLTNCDTLEHFPPFPFNALPILAKVPGAFAALAAPLRFAPARRLGYAPLAKRPIDRSLTDDWLAPLRRDKGIARDARKTTAAVDKRYTIEAAEKLSAGELPVRFAWGRDDRFFKPDQAEKLAAMLPDAEITWIDDAATFVPLDQPQAVAEAVRAFIGDRRRAAA